MKSSSTPGGDEVWGHPRALWMLFMTEFWERFCFYGMRWALTLYIVAGFYNGDASGETPANLTYGSYLALVYATGVLGGWVADKILGYQRSVLLGAVFIAAGLFTLLIRQETVFLFGLSLIIVGNGLFKPNISTMVGGLYKQGDSRRDRGFTIFYMGINAGAFFAPLLTGWAANVMFGGTAENPNYGVVFATAGIGMLIGIVWFGFGRGQLRQVGKPPAGKEGVSTIGTIAIGGLALTPVVYFLLSQNWILGYILWAIFAGCCVMLLRAGLSADRVQLDKIVALLILFLFNIVFWMFFEQAGASFNFLADKIVDREMFGGWEFPIGWFQSVNPAAIVLIAPVMTMIWASLDRSGKEPSIPRKFSFGILGNALGFMLLMFALSKLVDARNLIPFWPLAACYVIQTCGELCLSPIGLSMVTKLAPAHMVGATMGAWFMSISLGNKLAGTLAASISGETGMTVASALDGFTFSFYLLSGAGLLLFFLSPIINRLMHGVK
ncbi:MAG TPA: oligopeptide:H+ symporter [Nannocystaceae bacterium]|nr:oligopeptide:H+ symporter [Nannocystaceae bacterium]